MDFELWSHLTFASGSPQFSVTSAPFLKIDRLGPNNLRKFQLDILFQWLLQKNVGKIGIG